MPYLGNCYNYKPNKDILNIAGGNGFSDAQTRVSSMRLADAL